MGLNYLYHRCGKSLMGAHLPRQRSRAAHLNLGVGYVARINGLRRPHGSPRA